MQINPLKTQDGLHYADVLGLFASLRFDSNPNKYSSVPMPHDVLVQLNINM